MSEVPSIDAVLRSVCLLTLGSDPSSEAVEACLRRLAPHKREGDRLWEMALREGAIDALEASGVRSPAKWVDAALRQARVLDGRDSAPGTLGPGIVDIVSDGNDLAWLMTNGVVAPEQDGRRPWPRGSLPWKAIPTKSGVIKAIQEGARVPFDELRALLRERVILPKPEETWASLLAAWVLGTYLVSLSGMVETPRLQAKERSV